MSRANEKSNDCHVAKQYPCSQIENVTDAGYMADRESPSRLDESRL